MKLRIDDIHPMCNNIEKYRIELHLYKFLFVIVWRCMYTLTLRTNRGQEMFRGAK